MNLVIRVSKKPVGAEIWFVAEGTFNNKPVKGYSTFSHYAAVMDALKKYQTPKDEETIITKTYELTR